MIKFRLPLLTIIMACLAVGLSAQDKATPTPAPTKASATDKGGSVSIEDLYLSQEVEVQVLRSQVQSNSRESKVLALQNLSSMVDDKRLGPENRDMIALLEGLAGEGVFRVNRLENSVANDFPDVRWQAVELLGRIGGKDAKAILMRVALADKEPTVLAAAVYSMGQIATADDKDLLPYISKVMIANNGRLSPDNNLAYACLLTIEKLVGKLKGVNDPDLINALLDTTASGLYMREVRLKAVSVIAKLRSAKN